MGLQIKFLISRALNICLTQTNQFVTYLLSRSVKHRKPTQTEIKSGECLIMQRIRLLVFLPLQSILEPSQTIDASLDPQVHILDWAWNTADM